MMSTKKFKLQHLAWMLSIVVLLVGCSVSYTSVECENNINRKLKDTLNCSGLGAFCNLVNRCCGSFYCEPNLWSGTCQQGTCSGVGHVCGYVARDTYIPCCWGLNCNEQHRCVADAVPPEIHTIASA